MQTFGLFWFYITYICIVAGDAIIRGGELKSQLPVSWISNAILHGLFLCSMIWGERYIVVVLLIFGDNNCWQSLFKLSFHNWTLLGNNQFNLGSNIEYYLLSRK
jgi:hypothetical protein